MEVGFEGRIIKMDKSEVKSKKPLYKRWWAVTLLVILGLGIIGSFIDTSEQQTQQPISQPTSVLQPESIQFSEVNLDNLYFDLVSARYSKLTDLQKEEKFKTYKGTYIKSSGYVKEISDVLLSNDYVVRLESPENELLSGATLYFQASEKDKLLTLSKYQRINFTGKISSYNSLSTYLVF